MPTPYAQHLGGRDPVDVLRTSLADYQSARARIATDAWSTPLGPGKWTLHQVMVHVMQWEMIFGVRLRCALAVPGYVVQPLDQDPFMTEADALDGATAFMAFDAVRQTHLRLAASLSPDTRRRAVTHPERGTIDVDDLLVTLAGHSVHHLKQIQAVV